MDYGLPPAEKRVASDSGLSGLGLIMQLVGGLMTAIVACYGFLFLFMMMQGGGRGAGSQIMWILAILGLSVARSVLHAAAGRRLLYDGPGTPGQALKRYAIISAVHVGAIVAMMVINKAPGGIMAALVLMLGAWPLALLLVAKPKIEAFGDVIPMADDKGFEGAAILLLIFGSIGLGISSIMLMGWFEIPGQIKGELMGMGMLVAFVMLLIRSIFHLRAGIRGIKAQNMADTAEAANKYANFGVIAGVVAGAVFIVGMLSTIGGRGGGQMFFLMLIMSAMISWVLLVWPLSVRRFFSDRQFATMVDANAPGRQDSADRGLPTLGWLLLAFGVWALASGLASVIMGTGGGDDGEGRAMRRMMRDDNPLGMLLGMGSVGGKSPWIGIVVAALQVWAGVELIAMTARYKIAGLVYGGIAAAAALYVYLPVLEMLMSSGGAMLNPESGPLFSIFFAMVAIALVVPIATLIFVQRKVRNTKAIAQTFD